MKKKMRKEPGSKLQAGTTDPPERMGLRSNQDPLPIEHLIHLFVVLLGFVKALWSTPVETRLWVRAVERTRLVSRPYLAVKVRSTDLNRILARLGSKIGLLPPGLQFTHKV